MTDRRVARRAAVLAAALLLGDALLAGPALQVSKPWRLSPHAAVGETYMGIRMLGSVVMAPARVDGITLGGLSGLAWDEDESRLYALSDAGAIFHLRPRFDGARLERVDALAAFRLLDAEGRALEGSRADAEALVVRGGDNGRRGDSVLTVSFERHPRIGRFAPNGRYLGSLQLPAALRDVNGYAGANKALESLTWLPEVGYLTAPERPLDGSAAGVVDLFALDGRRWRYPLAATPNASLVDMEALPDGGVLALERGHGLLYLPMIISLRRTRLDVEAPGALLPVATVAVLDSSRGFSIDNFEGLARYRGKRYFMVSDDNFNELQKTLLVHFSLESKGDRGDATNVPEFEPRQKTTD